MKKQLLTSLTIISLFSFNNSALSNEHNVSQHRITPKIPFKTAPKKISYISLSAGIFDVLDDEKSTDLRVEYRSAYSFFGFISPLLALEASADGSTYAGFGLYKDIKIGKKYTITPSLTAGKYTANSGKDLGKDFQLRSQIEFGYTLENENRISLSFSHLSNASTGKHNPGTEIIGLYYHIPFSKFKSVFNSF